MDIGRFPRDQRADRLHLGAAQRGQVARAACRHAGRSRMTVSRRTMLKGGLAAGAAMAAPAVAREGTARPERWGVPELVFAGPAQGNPFVDVELAATFERRARSIRVPAFSDGEGVSRLRSAPHEERRCTRETAS